MKKHYLPYLLILLPPLFWAGNFIAGKAVSDQHISIGLSFLEMILIGTLFLLPLLYINPLNESLIDWNKKVSLTLFYIAIFLSIISYLIWNYGMQRLGAPQENENEKL